MKRFASGQFKAIVLIQKRSPLFWLSPTLVRLCKASVIQRKNLNFLYLRTKTSDKTSGFSASSPRFIVQCKVCCLAKQPCFATASWTILTKYCLESPYPWENSFKETKGNRWFLQSHKVGRLGASCNLWVCPQARKGSGLFTVCPSWTQPGQKRWMFLQTHRWSWPADVLLLKPCKHLRTGSLVSHLASCVTGRRHKQAAGSSPYKTWSDFLGSWDLAPALRQCWAALRLAHVRMLCLPGNHPFLVFSEISSLHRELPSSEGHDAFQQPELMTRISRCGRSCFFIRCIFTPLWGWQSRGCWGNKWVTMGVGLGGPEQPSTPLGTSSVQAPHRNQLDSVHRSWCLRTEDTRLFNFIPFVSLSIITSLLYLFTEWSFSD